MTTLPTQLSLQKFTHLKSDYEEILVKKEVTINFKTFYLGQSLLTSPYKLKETKQKFQHFKHLINNIKTKFFLHEEFSVEKKEINEVVTNLIYHKNFSEINEFLKNGLILNPTLISSLINAVTRREVEYCLSPIQTNEPLFGLLGELLFTSSHFQIYCHNIMSSLSILFPQQYIVPDINGGQNGISLSSISYDKKYGIQAIHMHNTCLNPQFSLHLFSHALKRLIHINQFEYTSIEWGVGSVLKTIFPYVKHYLSQDDKIFLAEIITVNKDKIFKEGATEEVKNILNDLYELVKSELKSLDHSSYKASMLKKVQEIYGNNETFSHTFLPLTIAEEQYLPDHKVLIDRIKIIHSKLSSNEELLDNENIDKVNKLASETLPLTIQKYNKIDVNFRESIKNIEGKNANQLFEESLTNILYTMKEVELILEQNKVNDLSITNRQNRIK